MFHNGRCLASIPLRHTVLPAHKKGLRQLRGRPYAVIPKVFWPAKANPTIQRSDTPRFIEFMMRVLVLLIRIMFVKKP